MSHEVYFPLHKEAAAIFLDEADIDARLARIAHDHVDDSLTCQAQTAIRAIQLTKDF